MLGAKEKRDPKTRTKNNKSNQSENPCSGKLPEQIIKLLASECVCARVCVSVLVKTLLGKHVWDPRGKQKGTGSKRARHSDKPSLQRLKRWKLIFTRERVLYVCSIVESGILWARPEKPTPGFLDTHRQDERALRVTRNKKKTTMRSLWLFLLVAGKRRRSGTVGQAALAVCNLKCVPNAPVRSLVFLHTAGNSADGAVWWPTHYTKLLRLAIRFRLWGFPSFDFHLMCWLLFEMAFAINSRQQWNLVLWQEWGFDFLKKINSTSGFFFLWLQSCSLRLQNQT